MLSVTSQYGLRAMLALSRLPDGELGSAQAIAQQAGIPANYLGKLLQTLAQAGLLRSQKGLGGGFQLARPAGQITLVEIVSPLENMPRLAHCLLGPGGCQPGVPCPAHDKWAQVRQQLFDFLNTTTLAELQEP
jgi:Rrf2 family protein